MKVIVAERPDPSYEAPLEIYLEPSTFGGGGVAIKGRRGLEDQYLAFLTEDGTLSLPRGVRLEGVQTDDLGRVVINNRSDH